MRSSTDPLSNLSVFLDQSIGQSVENIPFPLAYYATRVNSFLVVLGALLDAASHKVFFLSLLAGWHSICSSVVLKPIIYFPKNVFGQTARGLRFGPKKRFDEEERAA